MTQPLQRTVNGLGRRSSPHVARRSLSSLRGLQNPRLCASAWMLSDYHASAGRLHICMQHQQLSNRSDWSPR